MNGTQLAAKIRSEYTKTTTDTLPDSRLLPIVNDVKDEISARIAMRNESIFMMPAYQDLQNSSITAREYALPDDMMSNLFTVEVALDPAAPTAFIQAKPYPGGIQKLMQDIGGMTEAKIAGAFSNQTPYYILVRRGVFILSGTITGFSTGNGGFKIRYRVFPADLANLTGTSDLSVDPTTTSFGVPKQVHELWARRAGIIWKQSGPDPIPLSELEKSYEYDLKYAIDSISEDDFAREEFGWIPPNDGPGVLGASV